MRQDIQKQIIFKNLRIQIKLTEHSIFKLKYGNTKLPNFWKYK